MKNQSQKFMFTLLSSSALTPEGSSRYMVGGCCFQCQHSSSAPKSNNSPGANNSKALRESSAPKPTTTLPAAKNIPSDKSVALPKPTQLSQLPQNSLPTRGDSMPKPQQQPNSATPQMQTQQQNTTTEAPQQAAQQVANKASTNKSNAQPTQANQNNAAAVDTSAQSSVMPDAMPSDVATIGSTNATNISNNASQLTSSANKSDVVASANKPVNENTNNIASNASKASEASVNSIKAGNIDLSANSTVITKMATENPVQFSNALVSLPLPQMAQQLNQIVPPMIPSQAFAKVINNIPTGKLADVMLQMQKVNPENVSKLSDVFGDSDLAAFISSLNNEDLNPAEKKLKLLKKIKEIQEAEAAKQNIERATDFIEEQFGRGMAMWKRQSDAYAAAS